jgi:hypothetical protein
MIYEYSSFHGSYSELNTLCATEGWRMVSGSNGPGEKGPGGRMEQPTFLNGVLERIKSETLNEEIELCSSQEGNKDALP